MESAACQGPGEPRCPTKQRARVRRGNRAPPGSGAAGNANRPEFTGKLRLSRPGWRTRKLCSGPRRPRRWLQHSTQPLSPRPATHDLPSTLGPDESPCVRGSCGLQGAPLSGARHPRCGRGRGVRGKNPARVSEAGLDDAEPSPLKSTVSPPALSAGTSPKGGRKAPAWLPRPPAHGHWEPRIPGAGTATLSPTPNVGTNHTAMDSVCVPISHALTPKGTASGRGLGQEAEP